MGSLISRVAAARIGQTTNFYPPGARWEPNPSSMADWPGSGTGCYDSDPADALVRPFFRISLVMKTYSAKPGEITRDWYLVDAEGKTLGRIATQIADRLRGKGKTVFTPHVDTGDFVVVINAEKIAVTGKKLEQKMYYKHSGYPGGLRERTLREQLDRQPTEVLRKAVKGMLPRNKLGRAQLTKLKIYAGPEHPHEAQEPTTLEV
jgi:large subunit ribosomal protein L13